MTDRQIPVENADHVIGVFARERLSAALAATHRAGFGPQTRVLDSTRADSAQQLARLGLMVRDGHPLPADAILVLVNAPGRTATVRELFSQLGADAVLLAARRPAAPAPAAAGATVPDIRIGESSAANADL